MKLLWILWTGYLLYIVYTVYAYFNGKHLVNDMGIYNAWFYKKIGIALLILAVSYGLKHFGKISLAKWVAGVPAMIAGTMMLFALLAWLFTWFVMWWGSK